MAGDLGRADEIAEKHSQMPPLARYVVLSRSGETRLPQQQAVPRIRYRTSLQACSSRRIADILPPSAKRIRCKNFAPSEFSAEQFSQRIDLPADQTTRTSTIT